MIESESRHTVEGGKVEGVGVVKDKNLDRTCPRHCGSRIERPWTLDQTHRENSHKRRKSSDRTHLIRAEPCELWLVTRVHRFSATEPSHVNSPFRRCTSMNWSHRMTYSSHGRGFGCQKPMNLCTHLGDERGRHWCCHGEKTWQSRC